MTAIAVYTKSNCQQCTATKRWLAKHAVEYTEINLDEDHAAWDYVTDLGAKQAPVIVTEHGTWWTGFRPDMLTTHTQKAAWPDGE